ncbi:SRPBCC family protein [Hymenobacter oligotrophus]|uniref:SRPBCC family protein n=1 Tax=Hymenobacter oligotrophus TaxID=2319843 RepID=A0A3B7R3Y1_9BACT|nr:SRPBCC family protein [Hymenobacter oligotrophus]AYA36341.1 SRPBCC family protein [Hymenobacter oligotrophus]
MPTHATPATQGRPLALPCTPATGTSHVNVGPGERAVSAAAGAVLAYAGLKTNSRAGGAALAALGAALLFRGASGYCPLNDLVGRDSAQAQPEPVEINETFIISRPVEEVYAFWRRLENLPRFMQHLESIQQRDARHSHWKARIPGGLGTVDWDAEITTDEPNRLLAYRSMPGSQVDQSGEVRFRQAGAGATELQTIMHYRAPAGALGQGVARLLNPAMAELVRRDMLRFKQLLEAEGAAAQPAGPVA